MSYIELSMHFNYSANRVRFPVPNRHISGQGHHRIPQKNS